MTIRWSDKEVLVVVGTGAGWGCLPPVALGAGYVIMLAYINQIGLEAAANGLSQRALMHYQVMTQHVDVTSRASVAASADVAASSGRVTPVVHRAGAFAAACIRRRGSGRGGARCRPHPRRIRPCHRTGGRLRLPSPSMAVHTYPAGDPDVQRPLAETPTDQLLSLDACSAITDSRQAYPFAKRANHQGRRGSECA